MPLLDEHLGVSLSGLNYLWEVQTQDGQPVDTGALAEQVAVQKAADGSGWELKLTKLRRNADGLRVRCVLTNATTPGDEAATDGGLIPPGTIVTNGFIDFEVEEDPSKPRPDFEGPQDLKTSTLLLLNHFLPLPKEYI